MFYCKWMHDHNVENAFSRQKVVFSTVHRTVLDRCMIYIYVIGVTYMICCSLIAESMEKKQLYTLPSLEVTTSFSSSALKTKPALKVPNKCLSYSKQPLYFRLPREVCELSRQLASR